jgi:hypothetical protein
VFDDQLDIDRLDVISIAEFGTMMMANVCTVQYLSVGIDQISASYRAMSFG